MYVCPCTCISTRALVHTQLLMLVYKCAYISEHLHAYIFMPLQSAQTCMRSRTHALIHTFTFNMLLHKFASLYSICVRAFFSRAYTCMQGMHICPMYIMLQQSPNNVCYSESRKMIEGTLSLLRVLERLSTVCSTSYADYQKTVEEQETDHQYFANSDCLYVGCHTWRNSLNIILGVCMYVCTYVYMLIRDII